MYILDKETNQLITAEPTTFKEQKLKERQHLQEDEWSKIFDFFIKTTEDFIATFSKVAIKYKK